MQNETIEWSIRSIDDLEAGSFSEVIEARPKIDLLLIGCGTLAKYIEPNICVQLRDAFITAEAMDTGAACRTFNVLIAEDRRVAAALIPV